MHGMANKVEVLGLAARRQGLSSAKRAGSLARPAEISAVVQRAVDMLGDAYPLNPGPTA